MIPVTQTRIGSDGNCLAACIASILEVPLERVDFTASEGDWLEKTQKVLKPLGFYYLGRVVEKEHGLMAVPKTYVIFVGKTKRTAGSNLLHCVVGLLEPDGDNVIYNTVHNPLPGCDGLINHRPDEIGFLIPTHPQNHVKK